MAFVLARNQLIRYLLDHGATIEFPIISILSVVINYQAFYALFDSRAGRRSLFVGLAVIVGAFFFVQPAVASPGDTVQLSRFTDVQVVLAAISRAKDEAAALAQAATRQSVKQHLQKAAQSFGDAIADSLTAANLEHFFNDVRQGAQELDAVQGPRAEAIRIESGVTAAIRAATLEFIESIDQGIERIVDTRAREDARRRISQARDDYARGVSAVSAGRFGEAIDHWRHVFQKLVPVAAVIPATRNFDAFLALSFDEKLLFLRDLIRRYELTDVPVLCDLAVSLEPDATKQGQIRTICAEAPMRLGEFDDAEQIFRRALLDLAPNDSTARLNASRVRDIFYGLMRVAFSERRFSDVLSLCDEQAQILGEADTQELNRARLVLQSRIADRLALVPEEDAVISAINTFIAEIESRDGGRISAAYAPGSPQIVEAQSAALSSTSFQIQNRIIEIEIKGDDAFARTRTAIIARPVPIKDDQEGFNRIALRKFSGTWKVESF